MIDSASCDPAPLAGLDAADAKVRRATLRDLCPCHLRCDLPLVWDRVLRMAQDEDLEVRKAILHLLADGSPRERADEVAWAVGTMVNDPDPKLRRRARRVLDAYRRTGSVNIL